MLILFIKNSFLYENISVINNLGNIINSINSEKDFLFKQNLLKKYLFDDGLIDNEDVMNNLGKLLS